MSAAADSRPPAAAPQARAARDGASLARNITALAGSQVITWVMTLAWTLVVARALGPDGIGLIVTAWSVTGILGIVLGLGTRTYLVRAIVVAPDDARGLVGTAVTLRLLLTPVFVAAVVVYAALADYSRPGTIVLYLAAGATILTLLAEPLQSAFQAMERMQYLAYSDVLLKSGQSVIGIVLALLGLGAIGIAGSWTAVAGVVVVLNALWLRRFVRLDLRTTGRRLARMVRESLAYWAFGVFFLLYLWIDAVMLSLLTGPEVVGWYGVPMRLFQTMVFVPVVLSTAWLPRLVAAFERGPEHLRGAARTPVELVLLVSFPIATATIAASEVIVGVLYGSAYDESVPVLVVLGLCIPPMYLNIMLNSVLVAARRQTAWTWVMAAAAVINPLLNLALIPATQDRWGNGAIGAAASLLLTEVLVVSIGVRLVARHVVDRALVRRVALVAAVCAVAWGTTVVVGRYGPLPALAAGTAVFVGLAAALRLVTEEERALARRALSRVARRTA